MCHEMVSHIHFFNTAVYWVVVLVPQRLLVYTNRSGEGSSEHHAISPAKTNLFNIVPCKLT
jgi:hypothetical protein